MSITTNPASSCARDLPMNPPTQPSATPRTDALWSEHKYFANEDEAEEAIADFKSECAKHETELARLRAEVEKWQSVAATMSAEREHTANVAGQLSAEAALAAREAQKQIGATSSTPTDSEK